MRGVAVVVDPGMFAAAGVCAGLAASVLLLVVTARGTATDPTRPPTRWARWRRSLRSASVTGRVVAAVLAGVVTLAVTRWPVAALGVAALVAWWPRMFGGSRAEQVQIDRLEALVTWTESLRDTVAAHASLEHAIPATTEHAPPLIRPALLRLSGQIRARAPLDAALLGLASELDDASADLVIAALILNVRRRGDRLGEVLTGLATAAREELDMRRRVSAGRVGLRRGVQIVIGLTVAFAVFLVMFGGVYVRPYDTVAGQVALAAVVGIFAVGFSWMRRLSDADTATPFLHRPGAAPDPAALRVVAALTGLSADAAENLARGGAR
jgi:Flp pilus assembly protein TadB